MPGALLSAFLVTKYMDCLKRNLVYLFGTRDAYRQRQMDVINWLD